MNLKFWMQDYSDCLLRKGDDNDADYADRVLSVIF
jgi:hypothetical protein